MILLPRLITAIIGIPIVVLSIYFGNMTLFLLLLVVLLYMLREFVYMANTVGYQISSVISFIVGIIIFLSVIIEPLQFNKFSLYITSISLSILLFFVFFVEIIKQKPLGAIGRVSVEFVIPMLFAWSLAHIYLIRDIKNYGMKLTFILFFTIWSIDNAAYIFGTLFGKKKLASVVSPKKTIAGFIAGLVAGVVSIYFFARIFLLDSLIGYKNLLILGITVAVLSMLSDLAESLIKRDCGFKDSDNLLFGHGGMMDRFDSFLFTAPVYYYLVLNILVKK